MAITKGAKKAHRASLHKYVFNVRRKSEMSDVVKKVRKHVTAGELKEATALMPSAYKAIDKAAKRGVIKPNTASRKKSRLMQAMKRKEGKE
jgi:small subunit ribosomal protein S20